MTARRRCRVRARRLRRRARCPTPPRTATRARTRCGTCSNAPTCRCPISRAWAWARSSGCRWARRAADGDLRPPARARRRQGHDHRPLGDDGRRARAAVPDLPGRVSARGHRAVRGGDRPARAVQPAGLGHRHHRGAGRRACGHRRPIVYTSADSVFQIACHEEVVPVAQLYEWCETARAHAARRARRGARDRAPVRRRRPAPTRARRDAATTRCRRRARRISTCCRSGACRWSASARSARSSSSAASTWTTTRPTTRPASPPAPGTCARWSTACCSPISSTSTWSGAIATT